MVYVPESNSIWTELISDYLPVEIRSLSGMVSLYKNEKASFPKKADTWAEILRAAFDFYC